MPRGQHDAQTTPQADRGVDLDHATMIHHHLLGHGKSRPGMLMRILGGKERLEYFEAKFGVDVRQRFAPQLAWLAAEGFLVAGGPSDEIRLTRDGLLQVDRLLHEFFLPHHRGGRYT